MNAGQELKNILADYERKIRSLESEKKEINDEIKQLKKRLRSLESQQKKKQKDKKALQEQVKRIRSVLEGLDSSDPTTFLKAYHNIDNISTKDKALRQALQQVKKEKHSRVTEIKMSFTPHFRELCSRFDLVPVEGDEIKGFTVKGIFTVKINWDKVTSYIGTILQPPPVRVLSINPEKIVSSLQRLYKELFDRPFDPEEFLSSLYDAYHKAGGTSGKDILIKNVQPLVNKRKDEFSIDIWKLMASGILTTKDGARVRFSHGMGGMPVYDGKGGLKCYKFIRFEENRE